MSDTSIAAAVWGAATRTLTTGSPGAPTTRLEQIAKVVWEWNIGGGRTLSPGGTTPGAGVATLAGIGPVLGLGIRPPTTIRGG